MTRAKAKVDLPGSVAQVEAFWSDPSRWSAFVDGFARVIDREGAWPAPGARLVWDAVPGGRGRVTERAVRHTPGAGQTVEVEDDQLRGTQEVGFKALADGVEVSLSLAYDLKGGGPLRKLVDVIFIRRAIADSLRRTLVRLGTELAAEREPLL